MDAHLPPAAAARAGLGPGLEPGHALLKNDFSRPFFAGKLAIDQVLPYHNSALRNHAPSYLGQRPCLGMVVHGGRTLVCQDVGVLPPLLLSAGRTIAEAG